MVEELVGELADLVCQRPIVLHEPIRIEIEMVQGRWIGEIETQIMQTEMFDPA